MSARLRLIGLIRVSTEEQAQDGRAGLDRQEVSVRAIAARLGTEIELVRLEGVSGTDVIRSIEWRERVQPRLGPNTAIAVDAIDRLCRVDRFDFSVLQAVYDAGALIYTPSGPSDVRDIQGYLSLGIGALFGGLERMTILRRQQQAKEVKRARGEWVGPLKSVPIGTSYDRPRRRWGVSEDAARVRQAFELIGGGATLSEVTRRCGFGSLASTKKILRNPIYGGWLVYDEQRDPTDKRVDADGRRMSTRKIPRPSDRVIRVQVYGLDGQPEPIVPPELFDRVQSILSTRRASERRVRLEGARLYPYSGFLVSGEARVSGELDLDAPDRGHRVYGHQSGRRKPVYYKCACASVCGLPMLPARETNAALDAYLVWLTTEDRLVEALHVDERNPVALLAAAEKRLADVAAKAQRLLDLFLDEAVSRTVYDRRHRAFQVEMADLEREVKSLRHEAMARAANDTERRVRDLAFDPAWPLATKRDWLRANVASIVVTRERILRTIIRLPGTTAGTLVGAGRTWTELGVERPDRVERARRAGRLFAAAFAAELGITAEQVGHLAATGRLPEPSGRVGAYRFWTVDQVEAGRQALAQSPLESAAARWKRLGLLTTQDVCRDIGSDRRTLLRAVSAGKLTPHERSGRVLLWTREQVAEVRRVLGRS